MVYVDDSKLSGPKDNLPTGWSLLRGTKEEPGIEMEDPATVERLLGCHQYVYEMDRADGKGAIKMIEYDTSAFLKSCVERYIQLSKEV